MIERAKRRSLAQRIGQKGESIFSEWAVDVGLTRQKVDDDFGIDFFCQVMASVDAVLEEVTGSIIAVQVRSVKGTKRKGIKLDRVDAESALRVQIPYCLIGVDTSTRTVYHRFLDDRFLEELHIFLKGSRQSITFQLETMSQLTNDFARAVATTIRPGYQHRLRWKKGVLDIAQAIPGGRLVLQQNMQGGLALVNAPWLTSLFEIEQDAQDELADLHFRTGDLPLHDKRIRLDDAVANATKLVDGPTVLAGATDIDSQLEIHHGTRSAKTTCRVRRLGDETAFVTPSGLILSFSASRREGEQWVHKMGHSVANRAEVALGDSVSDLEFLKLMVKGAELCEPGHDAIPINCWEGLENLGPEIESVESLLSFLELGLENVYLHDLLDVEFMLTLDLVRAFNEEVPMATYVPTFVLDEGGGDPDSDDSWVDATVEAPIVANLKDRGLVVWFKAKGSLYRRPDGLFAGFKMGEHSAWDVELLPERLEKSKRPELWLLKFWPAIQVMTPIAEINDHFEGGQELEFGGDVWPLG